MPHDGQALYKRALAIRQKALGPEHTDVANTLNTLAQLYVVLGQYGEAEVLFKRSLAIFEKAYGPESRNVGVALGNLAVLYQTQGRSAEAEPLFKRTIAVIEKTLGPNHPYVGTALNNLAFIYEGQRRYAEAEPLFKRTIAILEAALGPDHPDVGTGLNNLAALYGSQARYSDSEPLLLRALAIIEKALGPEHASRRHRAQQSGDQLSRPGPVRGGRADLQAHAERGREGAGAGSPLRRAGADQSRRAAISCSRIGRVPCEQLRRSTSIIIRRTRRGSLDLGKPLTGNQKSEAEQVNYHFLTFVKAAYRLAEQDPKLRMTKRSRRRSGRKAPTPLPRLAQMAARGAKGDRGAGVARPRAAGPCR